MNPDDLRVYNCQQLRKLPNEEDFNFIHWIKTDITRTFTKMQKPNFSCFDYFLVFN